MELLLKLRHLISQFLSKGGIYSDVVRERGLEPPRPEGHQPLKLTRLPIPPLAHNILL
jgi:hypothetical protein